MISVKLASFLLVAAGATAVPTRARADDSQAGCQMANALMQLEAPGSSDDQVQLDQLRTLSCAMGPGTPAGSVFYPNGNYAFVGPGFSDAMSWKYPNGNYAYVGGNFADVGSWKYPNGNYAFVSGNYADAGSWKYPNGNYAFVSGNYSDVGSYKYANGNYAYVAGNFSDAGSWKYPSNDYAYAGPGFSDAGTWYYPNRNVFLQHGPTSLDGDELVAVVELYKGTRFWPPRCFERFPVVLQVLIRLNWVQSSL